MRSLIWAFGICLVLVVGNFLTLDFVIDEPSWQIARVLTFHVATFLVPLLFFVLVWKVAFKHFGKSLGWAALMVLALAVVGVAEVFVIAFAVFGVVTSPPVLTTRKEVINNRLIYVGQQNGGGHVLAATQIAGKLYRVQSLCSSRDFKRNPSFTKVDDHHIQCMTYGSNPPVVVEI